MPDGCKLDAGPSCRFVVVFSFLCKNSHTALWMYPSWEFNETFYNQPNWQRIMVSGGTTDPPLKVQAHAGVEIQNVSQAFSYDRQLP